MTESKAIPLKEEGNRCYQKGNFNGAVSYYSQALLLDPKNQFLYTNRAMARLKLHDWEGVVADCRGALNLNADSMKASYFLSQALLPLGDFEGALQAGLRAHAACIASDDKSLPAITTQVLRCKKERWDDKERKRVRTDQALERELVEMLTREREKAIEVASESEMVDVAGEWDEKIEATRKAFERGRAKDEQRREVPDWAIDDISFGIMVDPVITKTGKSYERASITEHLRRNRTDPLTREPLLYSELRPNLDLKQACEEFLEENGWAVDW